MEGSLVTKFPTMGSSVRIGQSLVITLLISLSSFEYFRMILVIRCFFFSSMNFCLNRRFCLFFEGTGGANTTVFTEQLLKELFPEARFSPFFTVERAHCIPFTRGPQGGAAQTFIFKLLHFWDCDLVLQESRGLDKFWYENAKLLIFPGYSVVTQWQ